MDYRIIRSESGKIRCSTILDEKTEMPLDPRNEVANHSPTGFEVGYMGSGPAQLALAILLTVLDEEEARRLHQAFKVLCISCIELSLGEWMILDGGTVKRWIAKARKEMA